MVLLHYNELQVVWIISTIKHSETPTTLTCCVEVLYCSVRFVPPEVAMEQAAHLSYIAIAGGGDKITGLVKKKNICLEYI